MSPLRTTPSSSPFSFSSWSRTSACSGVGSPCLEPSSSNSRPFGVSFCHVAPRSPRDGGHLSSTSSRNLLSLSFFFFFFSVGCLRVETRSRRFNFLRLRPRRPSGKGLVALSLSFTNVFVCGPSSIEAWCGFRTNPREEPASLEQCRRCPLKPLFFFFFANVRKDLCAICFAFFLSFLFFLLFVFIQIALFLSLFRVYTYLFFFLSFLPHPNNFTTPSLILFLPSLGPVLPSFVTVPLTAFSSFHLLQHLLSPVFIVYKGQKKSTSSCACETYIRVCTLYFSFARVNSASHTAALQTVFFFSLSCYILF